MNRFDEKLGFIHRRSWRRDWTYRVAVLLGPPPLLGGAAAALIWAGMHALRPSPDAKGPLPAWAPVSVRRGDARIEAAKVAKPGMELPPVGADGMPEGFTTGWQGSVQPVEITSTMESNILTTRLRPLVLSESVLDLDRIRAAGPPTGRFVGVENAVLAVRVAGTYALTVRVQHMDPETSSCVQRLGFGGQRVVSNLTINVVGPATLNFEPGTFDLQPGLYSIAAAFGCWREQTESGSGKLTVLIRHPGEQDLRPARPDEILRPVSPKP